ncbi:MAG: sodium:solute symporter [Salinibacter sp.]|uniref:sodium:solute symporter n=1 Tax=Salinibacter sp. TaxID=2065818 RepID=UPI0035D4A3B1
MLTTLDYVVITAYLLGVAVFGIWAGGSQASTDDYFLGSRDLPWWAVCLSVVATETSTLTVVGVPAVAYGGTLTFLQITGGYLVGRILVGVYFLPRYYAGELQTAYAFLGTRYGDNMQAAASITFLITRLLADGVRLFATAIPLKVVATMAGLEVTYFQVILVIGTVTAIYTLIGGIRAVVWMDVVQMLLYVGGALAAIVFLLGDVPAGWWSEAVAAGKTELIDLGLGQSFGRWWTQPYTLVTAVVGGAIFSMASHGTDQLIVQRLLACRDEAGSRKALVGSALVVMVQFTLFLAVGLLLWVHYDGASLEALGLQRGDGVFPKYIVEGLPAGLSGLILAGIVAAAMSSLSSSLNALASSSVNDLYEWILGRSLEDQEGSALLVSRLLTLFWGVVFIGFASLFQDSNNPVVELGLSIASFTYGGLLGAFLLGLWHDGTRQRDALVAFIGSIAAMVLIIFCVYHSPTEGWTFTLAHDPEGWMPFLLGPSEAYVSEANLKGIGWPWYTAIGTVINLAAGSLLALRHRGEAPAAS